MVAAGALDSGQGAFDIGLWADDQAMGGSASYRHRFSKHLYGFAEGRGWMNRHTRDFGWSATTGFGGSW